MKPDPTPEISRRKFIRNSSLATVALSGLAPFLSRKALAAAPPGTAGGPLGSHVKDLTPDPAHPFPVGVEYFRPPMPPGEFWDEDFKNIRATGMRIVRSFSPWGWFEPADGKFQFGEIDRFFDLAKKHDLKCWWDVPVGTHFSCPDWLLHKFPNMRVVWADGTAQPSKRGRATVYGVMTHNFDHPMWRVYVERYLRALVPRFKDHPSMLVWGTWDGIATAAAWARKDSMLPYNDYTIEKYKAWLKQRYSLDQLNDRLRQRYQSWDEVDAPRGNDAIGEMLMYRKFHYENLADHLGWMADLIDRLDGKHEQRAHGTYYPRQWDEIVSPRIDSWGLSESSESHLTIGDPYAVAAKSFGFQWARTVGRNHRWWNEEIYASFNGGLGVGHKNTLPEESTLLLWLSLIQGAAGALYWQYRPEYATFEAPGLNLVSLDGRPTPRLTAVQAAIGQIDALAPHLPLGLAPAEMAIGYSAPSMDVFNFGEREQWFINSENGVYRSLWSESIPQDLVTPAMDWSGYKAVCLPNFAVLDEAAVSRLRRVLQDPKGPRLIIEGHFGTFSGEGHWSFLPPDGLSDLIATRVDDFDSVTEHDIDSQQNILRTIHGDYPILQPCQYAILHPGPQDKPIAWIGEHIVGVQSANERLLWFGVPLLVTGGTTGRADSKLMLKILEPMGVASPFTLEGDRLVAFRRTSQRGGSLIFLLNLERKTAKTTVRPRWKFAAVTDLIHQRDTGGRDGAFAVELPFGQVGVFHCAD